MSKSNFNKVYEDVGEFLDILISGGQCNRIDKKYRDFKKLKHNEIEERKTTIISIIRAKNSGIFKARDNKRIEYSVEDCDTKGGIPCFVIVLTCVNCEDGDKESVFRLQFLTFKDISKIEFHKIT